MIRDETTTTTTTAVDCTSQSRRLQEGFICPSYIQLFNLDLQPCFVELNSGHPSWLVESEEALLRQVKHLTHYVLDTSSSSSSSTAAGQVMSGHVVPLK